MELKEITKRLQKIKSDIEDAFDKELIDFDEIENEISSIIEAVQNQKLPEKFEDKFTINVGNYT